jgi:hypothetical protein
MGANAIAHRPAVSGVGVFTIESRNPHRSVRNERGIEELGDVGYAFHASRGMNQRDKTMRLTATERCIEPEHRGYAFAAP